MCFRICHACAILNGIAGIVVFSAPSAVSSAWFPPNERTTATGKTKKIAKNILEFLFIYRNRFGFQ